MNLLIGVLVSRFLVPVLVVLGAVFVFWHAFASMNMMVLFLMASLPVLVAMFNRYDLLFMCVLVAGVGAMTIPGLPQELMLRETLAVLFTALAVFRFMVSKKWLDRRFSGSSICAVLFLVILAVHMYARGVGLKVFGSEMWGGMAYVRAIVGVGFMLAADTIRLEEKQWRRFVVVYMVAMSLPGLAQSLFLLSGGAIFQQYNYIRVEAWALSESLQASLSQIGIVRYHFLAGTAGILAITALVFAPWSWLVPLLVAALPLNLLSGFRSSVLLLLMNLGWFAVLYRKAHRARRLVLLGSAVVLFYFALMPVVPHLPLVYQRTLSFVPFYSISDSAKADAVGTLEWRWQIWQVMLQHVPEYLWLGRGLTADADVYVTVNRRYFGSPEYAYSVHNYHNGPLAFLVDLGIPGLVSVLGFMLFSTIEALRMKKKVVDKPFLNRLFSYLLAVHITQVLVFVFVFGDSIVYLPNMMFSFAMIKVLSKTADDASPEQLSEKPKLLQAPT